MQIHFGLDKRKKYDVAVFAATENSGLQAKGQIADDTLGGFLSHAIEADESFKGKYGQSLMVTLPKDSEFSYKRVIVMGVGETEKLDLSKARTLGAKLVAALLGVKAKAPAIIIDDLGADLTDRLCAIAEGAVRKSYKYTDFKTAQKAEDKQSLESITFDTQNPKDAAKAYEPVAAMLEGMKFTRDLTSMPPNALYPESFANLVEDNLKPLGVKVKVLDEKQLKKMGAGAIMAVGQGSARQPRMVVMEYNGIGKSSKNPDMALIGKGVTFDTGGYNIKMSNMSWMLFDMGGAGIVAGTMMVLAKQKAKKHVVAVLGLAENMVSSDAYRPSDIIKSLSGQTIEITNTDAEGRLCMADCMTYVQDKYKPKTMIDAATLTGATMVALGNEYAAAFTQDDDLWEQIGKAGADSGDKIWRMPIDEAWDKELDSDHADMLNCSMGRFAGASTAAAFLKRFVKPETTWAHLDVAGVVWNQKPSDLAGKGATGYGVALLTKLLG